MKKADRIKKYITELKACAVNFDTEIAHGKADDILCHLLNEIGYEKIVEEYDKVDKWYA